MIQKCRTTALYRIGWLLLSTVLLAACSGSGGFSATRSSAESNTTKPTAQYDIPEPPSWSFPDIVESARSIIPQNAEGRPFNRSGLAYPVNEIIELPVATMSPEELQKYADVVTHAYPDAVYRETDLSCSEVPLDQMNAGTIANVAYISLHAIDPDTRDHASFCLTEIQERLRRRLSNTDIDVSGSTWHKSTDGLDVIFVATDDFDGFLEEWTNTPARHAPSAHVAESVKRGSKLGLLLTFSCTGALKGSFDPLVGYQVLRPDGTVYGETPLTPAWSGETPKPGLVYLSDALLIIRVELDDPYGEYLVTATFKQNRTSVPLVLERTFVVVE